MSGGVRWERTTDGVWGDVWRGRTDELTVVLAAACGRIVFFGPADGANLLWVQPSASADTAAAWRNLGGEKLWLWPQEAWPAWTGQGWPPLFDPMPWRVEAEGERLRCSAGVPGRTGWNISRRLRFQGDALVTSDELHISSAAAGPAPRLWSVTQTRRPVSVLATPCGAGWQLMAGDPAGVDVRPHGGKWRVLPAAGSVKIGLDAARLRAVMEDGRWIELTRTGGGGRFAPAEMAQIYFDPSGRSETRGPGTTSYAELEFVAGQQAASAAAPEPLTLEWRAGGAE